MPSTNLTPSGRVPITPTTRAWDLVFKFALILFPVVMIYVLLTDAEGCGDPPMDYRFFPIAGGSALLLSLVWSLIDRQRKDYSKLQYGLQILVRYFLAYTIVYYGIGKVLDIQFAPRIFNLDTPVMDMEPMTVAWSFFGYSFPYEFFIGCSQIAAAILLLFRRTATLGAILMVTIMSNIVFVNFAFNVCVKFFSCAYLVMSIYLLLDDAKRLASLLLFNRTIEKRTYPELFRSRKAKNAFTIVCGLLIVVGMGYPVYRTRAAMREYKIGQHSNLYGYWTVDSLRVGGDAPTDAQNALNRDLHHGQHGWKTFIFEDFNTAGAKSWTSAMGYFDYNADSVHHLLTMKQYYPDTLLRIKGSYRRNGDSLTVSGTYNSNPLYLAMHLQRKYFIRKK